VTGQHRLLSWIYANSSSCREAGGELPPSPSPILYLSFFTGTYGPSWCRSPVHSLVIMKRKPRHTSDASGSASLIIFICGLVSQKYAATSQCEIRICPIPPISEELTLTGGEGLD
jgi:hypothetical protein